MCAAIAFSVACSAFSASFEDFLFTVQGDGKERGSGFLLKDTNGVWMISNNHVVRNDGAIKFVGMLDASRTYAIPETIEVAANRDAIRFKTGEPDGFALTGTSAFDDTVFAFGNSDGLGVITKSKGKIVGKGRGEIEVTCEIIPGNSGGPVIKTNGEVVGVATFTVTTASAKIAAELSGKVSAAERERLAEKLKGRSGTRYTAARRFAIPLHDAEWQPVSLERFKQESALYEQTDDWCDRFSETVTTVFRCRSISSENEDIFSRVWVEDYNQYLYKNGSYDSDSGRYYLRSGRKEAFDRAFGRWIQDLSATAERLAGEFRQQAETLTVLYYQNETRIHADKIELQSRELMEISKKYVP